jgi:uncharacterized protein YraI
LNASGRSLRGRPFAFPDRVPINQRAQRTSCRRGTALLIDYWSSGAHTRESDVSHTRQGFAAAIIVVLSAVHAAAEPAVVQRKLNLRSGPGSAFTTLAVLPAGTKLDTQKCTDEWCRVKFGRQVGYVSRTYLKTGSDSYASAAPPVAALPVEPKPRLTGAHVWRWNDSDWRNDHWRRLEWHNRMNRR